MSDSTIEGACRACRVCWWWLRGLGMRARVRCARCGGPLVRPSDIRKADGPMIQERHPDPTVYWKAHGPDCIPPDEYGDRGSCCCGGDRDLVARMWAEHWQRASRTRSEPGVAGSFDEDDDAQGRAP